MKITRFKTPLEVAQATLQEIKQSSAVATGQTLRAFVPTGRTPQLLYKQMQDEKDLWSRILSPIQIDEFIQPERIFYRQLKSELLDSLGVEKQASIIDPSWNEDQFSDHAKRVLAQVIHLAILGLGPNGHVGFHEPGLPKNFIAGRITISNESRDRVQGAKTNATYSFGAGAFLKARSIMLMVTGPEKAAILKRVINTDPTPDIPATLLKRHPDFRIFTDQDVD